MRNLNITLGFPASKLAKMGKKLLAGSEKTFDKIITEKPRTKEEIKSIILQFYRN